MKMEYQKIIKISTVRTKISPKGKRFTSSKNWGVSLSETKQKKLKIRYHNISNVKEGRCCHVI